MSRLWFLLIVTLSLVGTPGSAEARTPIPSGWSHVEGTQVVVSLGELHADEQERLMAGIEAATDEGGDTVSLSRRSSLVPWRLRKHTSWVVLTGRGPVVLPTASFRVSFAEEGLRLSVILEASDVSLVGEGAVFPESSWRRARGKAKVLREAVGAAPSESDAAALWKLMMAQIPRSMRTRVASSTSPATIQSLPASLKRAGDRLVFYDVALAEGEGEIADATRLQVVLEVSRKQTLRRVVVPPTLGDGRITPLFVMDLGDSRRDAIFMRLSSEEACQVWMYALKGRRWLGTLLDRRSCAP